MAKEEYSKLSTPELNKKKSTLKNITYLFIGGIIVLLGISIWSTLRKGKFDWGILVALSLSAIVFDSFREVSKITEEINSRE